MMMIMMQLDVAEDFRWHTKPPQPLQEVQPLLSPANLLCGVKCPNGVLTVTDSQISKPAHPLHFKLLNEQWPIRSPLLPHVHYHLFHLDHPCQWWFLSLRHHPWTLGWRYPCDRHRTHSSGVSMFVVILAEVLLPTLIDWGLPVKKFRASTRGWNAGQV